MIDTNQLVNGIWMGTVLIVLGFTPGLLQKCAEALSRFSAVLLFRFSVSPRFREPIEQPRWLAGLGAAIIAAAIVARMAG